MVVSGYSVALGVHVLCSAGLGVKTGVHSAGGKKLGLLACRSSPWALMKSLLQELLPSFELLSLQTSPLWPARWGAGSGIVGS